MYHFPSFTFFFFPIPFSIFSVTSISCIVDKSIYVSFFFHIFDFFPSLNTLFHPPVSTASNLSITFPIAENPIFPVVSAGWCHEDTLPNLHQRVCAVRIAFSAASAVLCHGDTFPNLRQRVCAVKIPFSAASAVLCLEDTSPSLCRRFCAVKSHFPVSIGGLVPYRDIL